jgi:hypothetical protein
VRAQKKAADPAFGGVRGGLLRVSREVALSVLRIENGLQVKLDVALPPDDSAIAEASSQWKDTGFLKSPDVLTAPGNTINPLQVLVRKQAIV